MDPPGAEIPLWLRAAHDGDKSGLDIGLWRAALRDFQGFLPSKHFDQSDVVGY